MLQLFLTVVFLLLLAVVLAAAFVWRGKLLSVMTVEPVDGNEYLYSMQYKAPYDLDEVVESNIDDNAKLLSYVVSHIDKGLPIKIAEKKGMNIR